MRKGSRTACGRPAASLIPKEGPRKIPMGQFTFCACRKQIGPGTSGAFISPRPGR